MRVLLTGAAGFIGSHVTRELLAGGNEVSIVIRPGDPLTRLADVRDRLTIIAGSLDDAAGLRAKVERSKPESCLHLAWYTEPGKYLHSARNLSELRNSLDLVPLVLASGCRHLVIAGSCAEYAASSEPLREDGATRADTLYAASKLALKLVAERLMAAAQGSLTWARIFYLYGPAENPRRLVPELGRSLLGGQAFAATKGEQVRDYLHVADVASAFCRLAQARVGGVYNVASGIPVTMRQLMETMGRIIGRPELIHFGAKAAAPGDCSYVCGDSRRLRALGWAPRYSLPEGLTDMAEWLRRNDQALE